jgi:hypothetical protein
MDPTCSKETFNAQSQLTTDRPFNLKKIKRKNSTNIRQNIKIPLRLPSSINMLKRKNIDIDEPEEKREFLPIPTQQTDINTKMQRVCYITNWSRYRKGEAKFEIEYIDPFMCSHIIYAYATVDDNRPEIIPIQKEDIGNTKIVSSINEEVCV